MGRFDKVRDVFDCMGEQHATYTYNLVSANIINGHIFLTLEEKLLAIGKALGKGNGYGHPRIMCGLESR